MSKLLITGMKQASGIAVELAQCFTRLQRGCEEFNKQVPPHQAMKFEDIYKMSNEMMLAWSKL